MSMPVANAKRRNSMTDPFKEYTERGEKNPFFT